MFIYNRPLAHIQATCKYKSRQEEHTGNTSIESIIKPVDPDSHKPDLNMKRFRVFIKHSRKDLSGVPTKCPLETR